MNVLSSDIVSVGVPSSVVPHASSHAFEKAFVRGKITV
jgi:hypothetical protein